MPAILKFDDLKRGHHNPPTKVRVHRTNGEWADEAWTEIVYVDGPQRRVVTYRMGIHQVLGSKQFDDIRYEGELA